MLSKVVAWSVQGFDAVWNEDVEKAKLRTRQMMMIDLGSSAANRSATEVIHMMDPEALHPHKHVQMRRVFAAFEAMLQRRLAVA